MKERVSGKWKKYSYLGVILVIVIIAIYVYIKNQPNKSASLVADLESFLVNPGGYWTSCWNEASKLIIGYDLSSTSPIDILFTPTNEDAKDFHYPGTVTRWNSPNQVSDHISSCYRPNILKTKDRCVIDGNGCLVLFNRGLENATVSLNYSAMPVISLFCETDDDCILKNIKENYRVCWPGVCAKVDYSLGDYAAVNKNVFREYQELEVKLRPSDQDCGPEPSCPVTVVNIDYTAQCADGTCLKVKK